MKKWKEDSSGKRATCHPKKRNYSRGLCRACYLRKFKNDNPDKKQAYYRQHKDNWLRYTLQNKFRMTVEQYEQMLKEQNGVRAICEKKEDNGKRLSVDHDHNTGEIRGLLCQRCNTLIGMAQERENVLVSAIRYLKEIIRNK